MTSLRSGGALRFRTEVQVKLGLELNLKHWYRRNRNIFFKYTCIFLIVQTTVAVLYASIYEQGRYVRIMYKWNALYLAL